MCLCGSTRFRERPETGMGYQRYFLTPPGLIDPVLLPDNWGLLEAHSRSVRMVRNTGSFLERARHSEINLLTSALRRVQLRIDQPLTDFIHISTMNDNATTEVPTGLRIYNSAAAQGTVPRLQALPDPMHVSG